MEMPNSDNIDALIHPALVHMEHLNEKLSGVGRLRQSLVKLLNAEPQLQYGVDGFISILEKFEKIRDGLGNLQGNSELNVLCQEIIMLLMTKPSLRFEIDQLFQKDAFDDNIEKNYPFPDCKKAYLYKSLGFIFAERMDYAQAIEMFLPEYHIRRNIVNGKSEFNQKITDRLSLAKCCYKLGDAYEHIGDMSNAFSYIREGMEQFENSFTSFDKKDDSKVIVLERLTTALYKAKFANRIAKIFKRHEPYNLGVQVHYREIALSADQEFLLTQAVSLQSDAKEEKNDRFKLRVNQIRLCTEMSIAFYHLGILNNNYDYLMRAEQQAKMNIQLVESLLSDYKNYDGKKKTDENAEQMIGDYVSARIRKCLLCLAQSFQLLGDIYHKLRSSDSIAQEYYQNAIATVKGIELPYGNAVLLLAELLFEYEKKFKINQYHYELELILKQYPHIYDLQCIARKLHWVE